MLALEMVMLEPLVVVTWVLVLAGVPTIAYFTTRLLIKQGADEPDDKPQEDGVPGREGVGDDDREKAADPVGAAHATTEAGEDELPFRRRDESLARMAEQKLSRMRKDTLVEFAVELAKLKAELKAAQAQALAGKGMTVDPVGIESAEQQIARAEIKAGHAEATDHFTLGWEAVTHEAWTTAHKHFSAALVEERTITVLYHLGEACRKLGRFTDALALIEEAEALLLKREQPADWQLLVSRGAVYNRLGRSDDALAEYAKAEELRREQGLPEDAGIAKYRGAAYRALGRYKDALAAYDRAEELRHMQGLPEDPGIAKNRGVVYDYLGRYDEVLAEYDKAEELRRKLGLPEDADIAVNRGVIYTALGRHEKALAEYARAEELRRERGLQVDPTITFSRALIYFEQGDLPTACKLAGEARDMYAEHALETPVHPNILQFIEECCPKQAEPPDNARRAR